MSEDLACDRLPDVWLPLVEGGFTNLGYFCGQKLVVFFCPTANPASAAQEIEAYRALAPEFEAVGTWVIGVVGAPIARTPQRRESQPRLGVDADGSAFEKLVRSLPAGTQIDRQGGATFLIDRDGSVRTVCHGSGHARQVLADAGERP